LLTVLNAKWGKNEARRRAAQSSCLVLAVPLMVAGTFENVTGKIFALPDETLLVCGRSNLDCPMTTDAKSDAANHWNSRFKAADFLFGTEPNQWLRNHVAAFPPKGRVLCVADGEGRNSVWLAKQGFEVDAFDIAEIAVAKARRLATESGVTVNYQIADCDSFAWPTAGYDGVAAIFVQFADPSLRRRLFVRMADCLKPGGTLILQGYTPKQLEYRTGGPSTASHLYTVPMLREAFAKLEIIELRDYEADLNEGNGHRGGSALLGMIARRPM
jgi:SAM-dependent methyltransferase